MGTFGKLTTSRRPRGNVINFGTPPAGDETPPSVVTGFLSTATGPTTITTTWNPSTDTGGSGMFRYNLLDQARIRNISGITQANPGVFTTSSAHGYATGDRVIIDPRSSPETSIVQSGGGNYPVHRKGVYNITVLSPTTFHIGVDTTSFPAYISGGHVGRVLGGASQPLHPTTFVNVSGLTPSTLYTYYCCAEDNANNIAAASVASGATTDAAGGSFYWQKTTPSTLPFIPGTGGFGATTCVGGSGRHAISGGSAAAHKIFFVTNTGNLLTALAWTGPKEIFIITNGLYDYVGDGELDIRDDYVTIIDLSPAPGALLKGAPWFLFIAKHIAIVNTRIYCHALTASYASNEGAIGAVELAPPGRLEEVFIGWNTFAYASDTIVQWYWDTNNTCFWGNLFMNPLCNSQHPQSPHGMCMLLGWYDTQQHISVYRNVFGNFQSRGPITGARQLDMCDNLIENGTEFMTDITQNSNPPTTGFPSFVNCQNNLYVRGPDSFNLPPIRVGFPDPAQTYIPHAGSQIFLSGNDQIGYTAAISVNYSALTLVGARVASGAGPGYNPTTLGTTLTEKRARAQELCDYAGCFPAGRLPQEATFLTQVMNNANQTGSNLGGQIDEGEQSYTWTGTPGTSVFVGGGAEDGDPAPGFSSITAGMFDAPAAWLVIQPSGYTAGEEWYHRRLAKRGVVAAQ